MENRYKKYNTSKFIKEMDYIYNYIAYELFAETSANRLKQKIVNKTEILRYYPKIYSETTILSVMNIFYRKITIDNYIILYLINERLKEVYIAHIVYNKSNYLENQKLKNL